METPNKLVKHIERHYGMKLAQIIEDDSEVSKVEFYKNENTFSLDANGNLIKLNLKNNILNDLEGLLKVSKTLTHLQLASTGLNNINLISNFTDLKYLDLSTNNISDITPLRNLKKLEFLYIDYNEVSVIPRLNFPLLLEFWAYSNKIANISNLQYLKSIKSLNISDNQIIDISVLSKLTKLEFLNLSKNKIVDITVLSKFKYFNYLDLSNNKITDLIPLKNISIKKELIIGQNQIIDLSPIYGTLKKRQINFLNAFENPLIYPPIEIVLEGESIITKWFDNIIENVREKINKTIDSKSKTLDIGRMGLTDLSLIPELYELIDLKELIISNEWAEYDEVKKRWIRKESENNGLKNNIFRIPDEINKLKNLDKLIIGGDWRSKQDKISKNWRIKNIDWLFQLKKLRFLNISNNELQNISGVTVLKLLEIGHFNNNVINKVPKLNALKNLKEIYLSNNLIENIEFLEGSFQIETVDLHSNKISNLIPLEKLLRNSKTNINIRNSSWEKSVISISKNSPNLIPPYEVIEEGKDDFFLYLKQIRYESILELEPYYNKEIKIILIGNSNAGKSTLLNYLKTKRLKKNIPITHWLVTEEMHNFKIDNEILKLRFFDFGGQEYYHDTHKMFFSSDCVYLLLWDSISNRLGEIKDNRDPSSIKTQIFPLEYWLDSIEIFAKKSLTESQRQMQQLLDERDIKINIKVKNPKKGNWMTDVLQTSNLASKILNNSNVLLIQNKIDIKQGYLNQLELVNNYPNIYGFTDLSLYQNKGKRQFKQFYLDIIKENANYNRPLLATWGYVKDNWSTIFKMDDFIIGVETFRERINNYLTLWLKNTLNKTDKEISNILLEDEDIILFAKFLKEIGLVIYHSQLEDSNSAIIVHPNKFLNEVYKILEIAKKNKGNINAKSLSEINHKEEVIRTLVNHKIIFDGLGTNYIAPLFLPENPDLLIGLLADVKTPFRRFKFKGFIPKSIILTIFSKVMDEKIISNEDFYYWKNGIIFKDKATSEKVLIKFNVDYECGFAYIDIFNFKTNTKNDFIKEFTDIIKSVIEQEGVGINELLTLDGIYFVDMKKLEFNYENRLNYISGKNFQDEKRKQLNIYNFNNHMDDNFKKPAKKLFISYSKQDEKLVNNFIKHLSSLQSSGIIESWFCTELKGGDDWDLMIKEKLNEADIVCFMISPNFMTTPYIHKYEVKHTFKRYENKENVKIIPIILDFIDWSRPYNFINHKGEEIAWSLNKFNALPFTGKEVVEFKNQNKAWYLIAEAIGEIASNDIDMIKDEDNIVRKFTPKVRKLMEDIIEDNI